MVVAMRRRDWLVGTWALGAAACGKPRDTTVAPEDLPPPPVRPAVPPDAFAVEGFGARLALRRPVHLQPLDEGGTRIRVVSEADGRQVLVLHRGGAEDEAPPDAKARLGDTAWLEADPELQLRTIAEAGAGQASDAWRLVVADARLAWPPSLEVGAFGGDLPRVELRRFAELRDVMVLVRGPVAAADMPPVAELAGPGQEVRQRHEDATPPWIELTYGYDGDTWIQRHWRIEIGERVLLVTAQATEELAERVLADGEAVATSVRVAGS
jgi:hypothetical protein